MARGALAAVLISAAAVCAAGCGGGETTTIIEKTVIERPKSLPPKPASSPEPEPAPAPQHLPALHKLPTYENWMIEPAIYSFGVSGNPAVHDLVWTGWGSPTAEGDGKLWTRRYEGGNNPSDYDKVPATLVASGLSKCEGRLFYTRIEAVPDGGGSEGALQLQTPCTGAAEFSPDAVTFRSETGED